MHMTLRTQALVALTALCIAGVAAAAVILFPRGPVYGPADLLPAEHTVAFFAGLDTAGVQRLSALLPIISTLPVQDTPATFAIVRMKNGGTAWIAFSTKGQGSSPGVTSSDPAALALLADGTPSLAENEEFRTLLSSQKKDTPLWAFMRLPAAGLNLPASWKTLTGPLSLSLSAQDMQLARITTARAQSNVSTGIRPFFVNPVFTLQAADIPAFIAGTAGALEGSRATAYTGLLKNWFTETFGPDLSLQYDLLPLLSAQSTISLGRATATGGLIAVMEGSSDGDSEKQLSALHEGFGKTLAGVARMQRIFDDKFTYDNIRVDGSSLTVTEEELAGWNLTISTNGQRTFATARNGRRFMMSNSASALRLGLGAYPPPVEGPAPVAQGSLDPQGIQTLLRSWIGDEKLLPPPLDARTAVLHWQVLRLGNVSVLRLF